MMAKTLYWPAIIVGVVKEDIKYMWSQQGDLTLEWMVYINGH